MKVEDLIKDCDSFPSSWTFNTDGNREARARYGSGYLSVTVSDGNATNHSVFARANRAPEIYGRHLGHSLSGVIEWDEIAPIIAAIDVEYGLRLAKAGDGGVANVDDV